MTTTNPQIQHLESLCVIHVDFDIWSGQTRLAPEDLKLGDGGEIPPESLALLGSKKICDPVKLRGFHRLKSKSIRTLEHYGLRFMNGWAVPADRLDTILKQLDLIGVEFEEVRQDFLSSYDKAVDEWCDANPGYEDIIRAGAMPRDVVETRIGFDYQVFQIQPVGETTDATQNRLNRKVGGLSDDLYKEIMAEANKFYEERLRGSIELDISTRRTLENLRNKVDGLSFLHGALAPLVRLLDETIAGYKQHAQGRYVVAPFLYQVVAAVLIMCDRSKIEGYANGSLTVNGVAKDANTFAGVLASAANEPEEQTRMIATPQSTMDSASSTPATPVEKAEPEVNVVSSDPVVVPEVLTDSNVPAKSEPVVTEAPTKQELPSPNDLLADMDRFFEQMTLGGASEPQVDSAPELAEPAPVTSTPVVEVQQTSVRQQAQPASQVKPEPVATLDDQSDWGAW